VITGPGNAWVAEAKRQLYGVVGIDMVAGPSEILVIADVANDPDWIAADLLSQAEHDPTSQSILITDDAAFASQVEDRIDVQSAQLSTRATAQASWDDNGVTIVVERIEAPQTGDRDHDVDAIVARFTQHLEKWVRAVPAQYFWQHRRWRRQPPDTPPELRDPSA